VFPVCGNTFRMLADSRLVPHFSFIGDFNRHEGLFDGCGAGLPFDTSSASSSPKAQGSRDCCEKATKPRDRHTTTNP
jgi:arsenite methyltransferase